MNLFRLHTWNFIAQAALSGTNLLINLFFMKFSSKPEFGLYSLCFSILMIALSFQNAISGSPLTVILNSKHENAIRNILSGNLLFQLEIFGVLFSIIIIFAIIKEIFKVHIPNFDVWLVMTLAVPIIFFKEFFRVYYYYILNLKQVLIIDITFVVVVLMGTFFLKLQYNITAISILFLLIIAYTLSILAGGRSLVRKLSLKHKYVKKSLKNTWKYSRWAILGVSASTSQKYAYIFIITYLLGLNFAADASGARLLFMPFGFLILSQQRIFLSQNAQYIFTAKSIFVKSVKIYFLCATIIWVIYFSLILVSKNFILNNVIGTNYGYIGPYVILWGIFFLFNTFSFLINHTLQVLKEFKALAITDVVCAGIVIISCFFFTKQYGISGSIASLILGDLTFILFNTNRMLKSLVCLKQQ